MNYRCSFERIGRSHNVPDLVIEEPRDADDIAAKVYRLARKHLASREVEVVVNLGEGRGTIYAGMHTGGSFTVTPA